MHTEAEWVLATGIAELLHEWDGKEWTGYATWSTDPGVHIGFVLRGWWIASMYTGLTDQDFTLVDARSNVLYRCTIADPISIDMIVQHLLELTDGFCPGDEGNGKPPWPPLRPDAPY